MILEPVARKLTYVPAGYRRLGHCLDESGSGKAYKFDYHGYKLWIPKKVLVRAEGGYWVPAWAIESAKKFAEQLERRK